MFGAILDVCRAEDEARAAEQRKLDHAASIRRHAEEMERLAAKAQEPAAPRLIDVLFGAAYAKAESPIEHQMLRAIIMRGASVTASDGQHLAEFGTAKLFAQLPIGGYRTDIALVDGTARLIIECDGREFHSTETQVQNDRRRDRDLVRAGWRVIRYSGAEIHKDADRCAADALDIFDAIRGVR